MPGTFQSPILAGSFGAALMPFFIALYRDNRLLAALGIVASATVVITSASSGPLGACIFGIVAVAMWPLRRYTRAIRWGIGITLLTLNLVMASPVWFLMARVDIFRALRATIVLFLSTKPSVILMNGGFAGKRKLRLGVDTWRMLPISTFKKGLMAVC